MLKITDTTLKRVINYDQVLARQLEDANRRQWRVMTLEVMKDYEALRERTREVSSALAYASYLHRVQNESAVPGADFFNPLFHNRLVALLQNLGVPLEDV